ncbi:flagellin [Desulfolutivibrio sulfoxidireducens]|uniref:flagellin N-terminal helical domain-containing protein n=1 Tax=Desulfolutivibrio sulfoxidireducens TaxID=2773299 RepID=UPI00210A8E1E|nr:flagellin [Desulfolutivibrio sulfoxidireducens]
MSLIINHNLMAQSAARNLSTSYAALSDSTRKLSSGLRITTAADDAAGLAVRELMRADIASFNQGVRNANDAISLIQTADGALSIIDEKLIRMKELAEQAATGTYTSDQRIIIDSEYQAMANEITRIANATDFNGIYLLNGNLSSSTHDGSGLVSTGKLKVHFGTANDCAEDYYYIQIGCATASSLGLGGISSGTTEEEFVSQNNLTLYGHDYLDHFDVFIHAPASVQNQFDPSQETYAYSDQSSTYTYVFATDTSGNLHAIQGGFGPPFTYVQDIHLSSTSGASSISTQELAQQALITVNNAIVSKDIIRANLGALQNRLENTISNLQIQAENLQAAESQISDVDVATEMTEFVRRQILTQAAVAMLSQANSLPQMALQLMG